MQRRYSSGSCIFSYTRIFSYGDILDRINNEVLRDRTDDMANKSNVQDDFFGDCDDHGAVNGSLDDTAHQSVDQYGELSIRDSVATERQYFVIGYHETYDECYEASLQNGFDDGYRNNYNAALHLGNLLGQYTISVATQKKLQLHPYCDSPSTESRLPEISNRVRNHLVSMTQNDTSRVEKTSSDERLDNSYGGITTGSVQTSTTLAQQLRLQEQKVLDDLTEELKNIVNVYASSVKE